MKLVRSLTVLAACQAALAAAAAPNPAVPAATPERIPFMKGLTTVRIGTSPVGDYETLRTVSDLSAKGFQIVTSGEAPADDGDGLIPVTVTRNVRAVDQLHSRNVRIAWHSSDRPNMSGNTPGISCDVFSELKTAGKAEITLLSVIPNFGFIVTTQKLQGVMTVVDRKPF